MKPDVAAMAALFAEPARVRILACLMDGRALPAGELAAAAGVSAQTASNHLQKLLDAHLLEVEVEGKYRYYRIASNEVASALEALASLSELAPLKPRPNHPAEMAVKFFRHCYSHMAGELAVAMTAKLLERRILVCTGQKAFGVTEAGKAWFKTIDIDMDELLPRNGALAKRCLDWTERRHHLGGPLGVAVMRQLLVKKWIVQARESRALRITRIGETELQRAFAIQIPARRML